MNFDPLSFALGNQGNPGPVRDVVSYLLGSAVGEKWQTLTNVSVAAFTAISSTLRELVIDVTPQQASGTPTQETPLPISGWTESNVVKAGKNLMAETFVPYVPSGTWNPDATFLVKAGTYFLSGDITNAATWRLGIKVLAADGTAVGNDTSYRPTYNDTPLSWNSNRALWGFGADASTSSLAYIIAFPKDCLVRFGLFVGGTSASTTVTNAQLEVGTAATAYEAYDGEVYTVDWAGEAGTVYGGSLMDNGDGTWTLAARPYYASYNGETLVGPWISSMDVYAPDTTPTPGAQVVDLGGAVQTYALTADSVHALIGQNNIFSDTGNINTIIFRTH